MTSQNLRNHHRYIPLWHFVVPVLILGLLAGSIVNLIHSDYHSHFAALCILIIAVLFIIVYWYIRSFALRAQDRAIRAEENFRHFILTGKPLDKQLRMSQVIALRFASDEELPALAKKAVEQQLSSRQLKAEIKNWKADYHRV